MPNHLYSNITHSHFNGCIKGNFYSPRTTCRIEEPEVKPPTLWLVHGLLYLSSHSHCFKTVFLPIGQSSQTKHLNCSCCVHSQNSASDDQNNITSPLFDIIQIEEYIKLSKCRCFKQSEVWAFGEDYHCTRLFVIVCLSSLMQRRYSEPNTYIDTLPSISHNSDDLYDDVASIADPEVRCHETRCNVLRF